MLGHGELVCGNGVHDTTKKQYGKWMIALVEDWHPPVVGYEVSRFHKSEPAGSWRGRGSCRLVQESTG
jgi:hypothetical protein